MRTDDAKWIKKATELEMANFEKITQQVREKFISKRAEINGRARVSIPRRQDIWSKGRSRPKSKLAA